MKELYVTKSEREIHLHQVTVTDVLSIVFRIFSITNPEHAQLISKHVGLLIATGICCC